MRYTHLSRTQRPGIVLLVVIAMLALFAVVGLSFVFFAESEANSSKVNRQAVGWNDPDIEPELLLNFFLQQLLFDTDSDASALRGHSLGRSMYGANPSNINSIPFNGVGRLKYSHPDGNYSNHEHINYKTYPLSLSGAKQPRVPDYYYTGATTPGRYVAPNGPSTYPDLDNVYLAAVNGQGEVLEPSMHRRFNLAPGDWSDPTKRYKLLRPHPMDHPQFPPTETNGGDVKNLDNSPGMFLGIDPVTGARQYAYNDSYWIDPNFPVLTAPDGTKYKALFAPLIMDLDNKINLNVAGNRHAGAHAGHQGWGPWEINPSHVLNATEANSILGMRYDTSNQPISPVWPNWGFDNDGTFQHLRARSHAPADFNAVATGPLTLPAGTAMFPTFPGYSAANIAGHPARYNPMNDVSAGGSNKVIHPYHLEAVLRYLGSGSPALDSDLFRTNTFAASSFRNTTGVRSHFMVTPFSFDSNRPGLSPWLEAGSTPPKIHGNPSIPPFWGPQQFPDWATFAGGGEFSSDTRSTLAGMGKVNLNRFLPPYPHMGAGTNAGAYSQTPILTAPVLRHDDNVGSLTQFVEAQTARQRLADDIYRRLLALSNLAAVTNPNTPDLNVDIKPRRFLAQLAVNIVDFIDEDDLITPFQFYGLEDGANPTTLQHFGLVDGLTDNTATKRKFPKYHVFGNEMPRVVLNEVLNEYQLPGDGTIDGQFFVKFWAELKNAFPAGTENAPLYHQAAPGGGASQSTPAYSPYQIVIAKNDQNPAASTFPEGLKWHEHNVLGAVDYDDQKTAPQRCLATWDNANVCTVTNNDPTMPSVPAQLAGGGYMLVGPNGEDINSTINAAMNMTTMMPNVPGTTPWRITDAMRFPVTFTQATATWTFNGIDITEANPRVTVALRRLANPYMPFDNNPRDPGAGATTVNPRYNPYITVDYVEVQLRQVTAAAMANQSQGRQQPMSSQNLQAQTLNPAPAVGVMTTQHSLGRDNNPTAANYDWMPHLDRRLVSPIELFHVSMYKPHQLTRKFITTNGPNRHARTATDESYWMDPNLRVSRFLELATVGPKMAGLTLSGRVPGKVNINTLYDLQVLQALLDPQAGNGFTAADVSAAFNDILQSRNAGSGPGNIRFAASDRPFLGMGVGEMVAGLQTQYVPPLNVATHSLLRDSPSNPGAKIFELPAAHPYQKWEMLNKVYNNLTTRSNTFALFLTVGFFEVTQDNTGNWTLGRELNKDQGRNVRRRMFALIDRTSMVIPAIPNEVGAAGAWGIQGAVAGNPTMPATFTVNFMNGTPAWPVSLNLPAPHKSRYDWTVTPGMTLQINGTSGGQTSGETFEVQAVTPPSPDAMSPSGFSISITGLVRKSYTNAILTFPGEYGRLGSQYFVYGNPGPQPRFNAINTPNLVPFFSVIQ